MKKIFISLLLIMFSIGVYFIYPIWINPKSPKAKTSLLVEGLKIEIFYSSPSKRGRLIFGMEEQKPLLTYGKYWRLGANAPTKISVDKDIKFAGQVLKSGNYSMYVVPFQNYWEVTLNSKINSSGYERPDPINDILTVSIPLKLSSIPKEQLTISLKKNGSNATMTIEWENVVVVVPIEIL